MNKDLYRVIALVAEGAKVAEERRKTAVDKLLQPPDTSRQLLPCSSVEENCRPVNEVQRTND